MLLPGTDVMNIVRQDKLQAHVQATLSLAAAFSLLFALLSTPMNQGVQRWHDGWRTRVVHVSYP